MLTKEEFIADCQEAVDDICAQMDEMCAPFACTHEHVTYPSFFAALGIAQGNSAIAHTVAGLLLAFLVKKYAERKARQEANLLEAQPAQ